MLLNTVESFGLNLANSIANGTQKVIEKDNLGMVLMHVPLTDCTVVVFTHSDGSNISKSVYKCHVSCKQKW